MMKSVRSDFPFKDPGTNMGHVVSSMMENIHPLIEEREILLEKRHYLHDKPEALPKVLLAAHCWDWACLPDLHASLTLWHPLPRVQALQLLLPCFPDMKVREMAVEWIRDLNNDELVDYLPQLLQALKHETYETSTFARFLLERALLLPRVAHHIYWLLTQALPGQSPQAKIGQIHR